MNENCQSCTCTQYADDSNMYKSCKPANIANNIKDLEKTLKDICIWSENKNLIFNPDKTKFMIFTTTRSKHVSKHKATRYEFRPDNELIVEISDCSKLLLNNCCSTQS